MNNKWKKYIVGDLGKIVTGKTPKTSISENYGGIYPFLTPSDDMDVKFVKTTNKTLSDIGVREVKNALIPKNSVCVSCIGSDLGKVVITTNDTVTNQQINSIIVNQTLFNVDFIYYSMIELGKILNFHSKTSTAVPIVNKTTFSNYEIYCPNLIIQNKIASILSAIDEKIELNNETNNNLEQQAQAIFKSWFVDFEPFGGTMPSDWNIGVLSDIADFSNGYAFKSNELLDSNLNDSIAVFKQGHINRGGGFNSSGTKSWYPINKTANLNKYILKKGDILMAMTDMKDNVAILGNTALMPVNDKYIVNQRVGLIRCNNDLGITHPFIYIMTNTNPFLSDLRKRANSGVQVNLSSEQIKNSPIIIPTVDINKKYSDITIPIFEQIFNNDIENQHLSQLRDTLLPKLMSGEIDVENIDISTDKLYEPANESKLSAEPYNSSRHSVSASNNLLSEQSSSADKLSFSGAESS